MDANSRRSVGSICGRCGKRVPGGRKFCRACEPEAAAVPAEPATEPEPAAPPDAGPPPAEEAVADPEAPQASGPDAEPRRRRLAELPPVRTAPGLLLGVAGGALAMAAWGLLIHVTGYEIGYAAWGVGVVTGLATVLGARRGAPHLGIAAGVIAAAAIVGGQFLVVHLQIDGACCEAAEAAYVNQIEFAKKATQAKSPDALRHIVAEWNAEEEQDPDPDAVSDADIQAFVEEDLPDLESLLAGDPSREQFVANVSAYVKSEISYMEVFKESVSIFTALWLFLGVGTAYRIASGGSPGGEEEQAPRRRRRPVRKPKGEAG